LFSTSGGIGNAGSLVSGLAGGFASSKNDASGDKAVRQMLRQIMERLDQFQPPITPAALPQNYENR
jgi:hypothetical protein